MIKVKQGSQDVDVKFHTFSGGEEHVNITLPNNSDNSIRVYARIHGSGELMRLLLVTDALKREGFRDIELIMPYIPYARQDRVCQRGDAFSLKVFANLINTQQYASVTVADAHSTVATALIDNVVEIPQSTFAASLIDTHYDFIISPDAGASKKTIDFAKNYDGHVKVAQALKVRDITGNIVSTEVLYDDFAYGSCLIVDDICDGGRTFTELATVLKQKGAGEIGLYVTHGIFSKGTGVLLDHGINNVYTTDSFNQLGLGASVIYKFFE